MTQTEIELYKYYYAKKDYARLLGELETARRKYAEEHLSVYGSRSGNEIKIKSNRISDPTGNLVANILERFQEDVNRIESDLTQARMTIDRLERIVSTLPPREKKYVELRYFQSMNPEKVLMKMQEYENRPLSMRTLDRARENALKELEGKI
jgi:hypothetical protein